MAHRAFLDRREAADARTGDRRARGANRRAARHRGHRGQGRRYVELPWKAFALGAALAALVLVVADALSPRWTGADNASILRAVAILGVGRRQRACSPSSHRLRRGCFCARRRRDARSAPLRAGVVPARASCSPRAQRNGILLLVSLFERKVEILADVGLHARVDAADWRTVIDAMTPLLRERRCFGALAAGRRAHRGAAARARGIDRDAGGNELPDRPMSGDGRAMTARTIARLARAALLLVGEPRSPPTCRI